MPPTLLLAERDEALRTFLCDQMAAQGGYAVTAVADAQTALTVLDGAALDGNAPPPPDAALLDATLDAAGTLTSALRAAGTPGPIIHLLPVGTSQAPAPLPPGVDAAFTRPLRLAAVLECLRAPSPCPGPPPPQTLAIGPHIVHLRTRMLESPGGQSVRLTDKEVAILSHLRAAGGVVSRDALLGAVWGYGDGIDTHTLETHIYRLRRKIEADPAQARLLITQAGGYTLVADDA